MKNLRAGAAPAVAPLAGDDGLEDDPDAGPKAPKEPATPEP